MIKRVLKNRLDRIGKYLPQTHFFDKAFCQYDYFLNNGYIVKNPKTFKEFIFKQRYEDNSFLRKLTTDKECAKW